MQIEPDMPQRVAIIIEKNKSETWSVSAYLVSVDGRRARRSLGAFETYNEAATSLKKAWEDVSLKGQSQS